MTTRPHHYVTVDAESDVIEEGIRTIDAIRGEIEREQGIEIPIVWFVRFQRAWQEYVTIDSPEHFAGPIGRRFDGFERAAADLRRLRARGDEIAWHYHAYNYVHRDDLAHDRKVAILHADLATCAAEIRDRYTDLGVRTLRFGWFFIPDFELFHTLRAGGIRVDASLRPSYGNGRVGKFRARYLSAPTNAPHERFGIRFVPFERTSLVHDWNVVAHEFDWSRQTERASAARRRSFGNELRQTARGLGSARGAFLTYERSLAAETS